MPIQSPPQWAEFLSCPVCYNIFDEDVHKPISLACGHTVCKICLTKLTPRNCPFDNTAISRGIDELPVNFALLQLVGVAVPEIYENLAAESLPENVESYNAAKKCIEELAIYLKPVDRDAAGQPSAMLSRPMQRKLVTLVNCQLVEEEGRARALRAVRSLAERTVTELILQHQNPQQLSANLWAAVRARGCQFLGPAMQEEVLKLILLALEDGSALSRKVLVLFVVQRLEAQYPQASKTAIGHVVQLLYRASCFKVTKREEESSLMQLKDEFRTYDSLRREHDSQIVQIATEAGLRISPEQWSSLLYGDTAHKSHMQSIIDKLQTPQSFHQAITELSVALQRALDPTNLLSLMPHLELLASIDPDPDAPEPSWEELERVLTSLQLVMQELVTFTQQRVVNKQEVLPLHNPKYKTSMCRDVMQRGKCPRGANCTFAHSADEMEKHRQRSKRPMMPPLSTAMVTPALHGATSSAFSFEDGMSFKRVSPASGSKQLSIRSLEGNRSSSSNVSVPIAVPNTLPSSVKARLQTGSIYTSIPVHGQDKEALYPTIIPVAQKAPHIPQGAMPKRDSQSTRTQLYKTQSAPVRREEMPLGSGYVQQQGWVIREQESKNAVLVMPQHPYAVDRCGLNPRDAAIYNSREIRSRGKSPSQQLEDLQKRRSELVAQLTKTTTCQDPQLSGPHVSPSSASAISHRIYDRKSESPMQPPPAPVASPDVHVDIAKTHMTFSSQASQAHQPGLNKAANERASHNRRTNQMSVHSSSAGTTLTSANPTIDIVAQYADTYSRTVANEKSAQNAEKLIGVSVQVTAANAVVHMVTVANSNATSQSPAMAGGSGGSGGGGGGAQTTTINTVVTITVAQTFQTNPVSVEAQTSNRRAAKADDGSRFARKMTRPLADSMATSYTTMTLANLVASSEQNQVTQSVALSGRDTNASWTLQSDQENIGQGQSLGDGQEYRPTHAQVRPWNSWNEEFVQRSALDDNDEFIPLSDDLVVSKYGPISRMVKAKLKQAHPVQVTAGQPRGPHAVTAVTPVNRPFPMTAMVPSRFVHPFVSSAHAGDHFDHRADPCGMRVASSLPTALMQPNVIASSKRKSDSQSLWNVNEKMLSMSEQQSLQESALRQEQIRYELVALNSKIQHLQMSEDERLARELHAIELDIEQAEKNVSREKDFLVAQQAQGYEIQCAQAKLAQENEDQRYAVSLAVSDAEEYMTIAAEQDLQEAS